MTDVYMSAATAAHAEKIQDDHADDGNGLCGFCSRHFNMQVPFGSCSPYRLAQGFIDTLTEQQRQIATTPPTPKVEFTRTGGRVWPTET